MSCATAGGSRSRPPACWAGPPARLRRCRRRRSHLPRAPRAACPACGAAPGRSRRHLGARRKPEGRGCGSGAAGRSSAVGKKRTTPGTALVHPLCARGHGRCPRPSQPTAVLPLLIQEAGEGAGIPSVTQRLRQRAGRRQAAGGEGCLHERQRVREGARRQAFWRPSGQAAAARKCSAARRSVAERHAAAEDRVRPPHPPPPSATLAWRKRWYSASSSSPARPSISSSTCRGACTVPG